MKKHNLRFYLRRSLFVMVASMFTLVSVAQTNVFDDVISTSPNHLSFKMALERAGLDDTLRNATSITVFAPDDQAVDSLAARLNTTFPNLLLSPDLRDILLHHFLGSQVLSAAITNGDTVSTLNGANSLKLTKKSTGSIFINNAEINLVDLTASNGVVHSIEEVLLTEETVADIAIDNGFTSLVAAVATAELLPVLTDPFASLTVFAPTNTAIDTVASRLGTDIAGLLALPNLADIISYHVLGSEVMASSITNGAVVAPLSNTNTLKLTKTGAGDVFVNQAQVTLTDLSAFNGLVHVVDAVVLPGETVADIAIDSGFSTLVTAIITAELLPALTDPFASLTVFAPNNEAFDSVASRLGVSIADLLVLPNLSDILLYHALGSEVASSAVTNGAVVAPLSTTNTLKLTKTTAGDVFVNQAQVTIADILTSNGVVHAVDAVLLPGETVADVAIDNGFSTLVTAVATAELLPALTDPFASLTVFAPNNEAFDSVASRLGVSIADLLVLPNLADILTYHVLGSEVASSAVTNGAVVAPLSTTNTLKLTKTTAGDVFVNHAQVILADVPADNGVVHVLNEVVLPGETVADVAIDNGFTTLVTAVATAELLPALTDPFASLTVFAPNNEAFDSVASRLGVSIADLLVLPNLADILTYHVLGSEVASSAVTNGAVVAPLSTTNTLKLTKTTAGDVFVNHAQVILADVPADNGVVHVLNEVVLPGETVADVAIDNGFTTLVTAVATAELLPALTDPFASLTVFAPNNEAFDSVASRLGVSIADLLVLPNLADILTYHVLGSEVASSAVTNGAVVAPLSTTNTLKLTKTTAGDVFVNHAQVILADVPADNGVVHVLNEVVLPGETVADVAIDNGFTTLVTAVATAELLPALTDPFASLTVFAPNNEAFDSVVSRLGVSIADLLVLPNLADILTYHVLGSEVASSAVTNGAVVAPLSTTNTLKLTKTTDGDVFVNHAQVILADVTADNGVVHVLNEVVLPRETVADVAIDNGFSTLVTAVATAELLPALTDPFASLTVFAPNNEAFDNLAVTFNTDLAGVLALPDLADILLYHVVAGRVESGDLTTGTLPTLNGEDLNVDITDGIKVNAATIALADVPADNGIVHVLETVLKVTTAGLEPILLEGVSIYPNPAVNALTVKSDIDVIENVRVINSQGAVVMEVNVSFSTSTFDISSLVKGIYFIEVSSDNKRAIKTLVITK